MRDTEWNTPLFELLFIGHVQGMGLASCGNLFSKNRTWEFIQLDYPKIKAF